MSQAENSCPKSCTSPQLQLYQTIIFATPVLFAFLLLVLFCMLCIRRRRDASSAQTAAQIATRALFPVSVYERGLSKSFRQQLPIIPFDEKIAASATDIQCAVCLGDYELHEKLQQLPPCKHLFHVPCIDEWLAKNTTCPICRTSLLQETNKITGHCSRQEENRRWEDMVVNEFQDGGAHIAAETSNGASSSGISVTSSETAPRFSTEHVINVERS